jgi:hypothetical protein
LGEAIGSGTVREVKFTNFLIDSISRSCPSRNLNVLSVMVSGNHSHRRHRSAPANSISGDTSATAATAAAAAAASNSRSKQHQSAAASSHHCPPAACTNGGRIRKQQRENLQKCLIG